jgi:FixJ family two-component response regulator
MVAFFNSAPASCTAILASETDLWASIFKSSDTFCDSIPVALRVLYAATFTSSYTACVATHALIFLTGYPSGSTLERMREVEPEGYIVKPFQEKNLLAVVRKAIDGRTS